MPFTAPVMIALLFAVLVTLGALVWTVVVLVRRLRSLGGDLDRLQRELTPALEGLQADAEVTSNEMRGLTERFEHLEQMRAQRPRRRWRPPPAR